MNTVDSTSRETPICDDPRKLQSDIPGQPVAGLEYLWTYSREQVPAYCHVRYWRRRLQAVAMPESRILKEPSQHPGWILFFIYSPQGRLDVGHEFTLRTLAKSDLPVLVVMACDTPDLVPPGLLESCDAVIWKATGGYDFSAYAVGLHAIADHSPRADVLVLNDSILGPLCALEPFMQHAPWDLTGFAATDQSHQRHIQSYAFILKKVDHARLAAMGEIFSTRIAYNDANAAIGCREMWMAHTASRTMTVGSYWFGPKADPTLTRSLDLVDAGLPFIKRSLLDRFRHLHDPNAIIARLEQRGHPDLHPDTLLSRGHNYVPAGPSSLLGLLDDRLTRFAKYCLRPRD